MVKREGGMEGGGGQDKWAVQTVLRAMVTYAGFQVFF